MNGKRWAALILMMAFFSLSGCGGREVSEEAALKNGDRVTRELTDTVTLDAEVRLPENWDGTAEVCTVKQVFVNGEEMAKRLYPEIPEEDWERVDMSDAAIYQPVLQYMGEIWIEEGQEPQEGWIVLGGGFNISTNRAAERRNLFTHTIYADYIPTEEDHRELEFCSVEDAVRKAETYWTERVGLEDVSFTEFYAVTFDQLIEEEQAIRNSREENGEDLENEQPLYEWDESDNCYDLRFEQVVNGLPLTGKPYTRDDKLYVPSGEIVTICTENGIDYVSYMSDYEIQKKEKQQAASLDRICEALGQKFKMIMGAEAVIDSMELVYYPFPLNAEELNRDFEFVPAWRFSFDSYGVREYVYINAVSGEEITA